MSTFFKKDKFFSKADKKIPNFSKWPVISAWLILMIASVLYVFRDTEREKAQLIANMKDRADVLIWALEGGTRSMMGKGGAIVLQPELIEEIANQPNVAYVVIADSRGKIYAQSDTIDLKDFLSSFREKKTENEWRQSTGKFIDFPDGRIYEVSKAFTPTRMHMHYQDGKKYKKKSKNRDSYNFPQMGVMQFYIYVGIDATLFEKQLDSSFRNSFFISFLIATGGGACLLLLYVLQNYRASRQLLEDTQALTTQIVTNLPIGIIIASNKGEMVLFNSHSLSILGVSSQKEVSTVFQLPFLDWSTIITELNAESIIFERELDFAKEGVKTLSVSLSAARIQGGDGASSGYLFILRDLGEVKKLQKQLSLTEKLSALGSLAAGVAHEIRNPLSSIKGYATFLLERLKDDDAAYDSANIIIQEVDRLNRVVTDLLGVARSGELNLRKVNPKDLIEQALRLVTHESQEKSISIQLALGTFLPIIIADPDKLLQALLNILLNALQATDVGGEVVVTVEYDTKNKEQHFLAFRIADNGSGMSSDVMGKLFTPYFTTKANGSGLGLMLTHQIIEQHGGEIKVSSQEKKGSVFTLYLPASI